MMNSLKDTTVILRECGERTADMAFGLLQREFPDTEVIRVEEVPFSQSVKRSFEWGLEAGKPWTLCIDADVLILSGAVSDLLDEMEKQREDAFEIQGVVFDKFLQIERPAGNHLYRTSLLEKAIPLIPVEGDSVRPESDTLAAMNAAGHPWVQSRKLIGIHDFEQSYFDIYQKCFLQAQKHRECLDFPVLSWEYFKDSDPDFAVALRAVEDGFSFDGTTLVDRRFREEEAQAALGEFNLPEQSILNGEVKPEVYLRDALGSLPLGLRCQRETYQARMNDRFFARSGKGEQRDRIRRLERKIERLEKRLLEREPSKRRLFKK